MRNSRGQALRDRIYQRQRERRNREEEARKKREEVDQRLSRARWSRRRKAEERTVRAVLDQREWWWDWKGDAHAVKSMTIRHKKNLLGWLERNAPALQEQYVTQMSVEFAMAPDDVWGQAEHEMERLGRLDPVAFIIRTPLYKAIRVSIARGEELESDKPWQEGGRERYIAEVVRPEEEEDPYVPGSEAEVG